ncbi:MAG: glycosyltransferase family 2 protein [Rubripirellula sp.]
MILLLSVVGIAIGLLPLLTFLSNVNLFRFETTGEVNASTDVSVLIPARDEQDSIRNSVRAALDSRGVNVEVIVLDDHSVDQTAAIVKELEAADSRVRYFAGVLLPDGWNGKQHACKQLSEQASHERLVFLDADVRLQPNALQQLALRQDETQVALLSAFPYQETGTWMEQWIIPMMHFILLGFLPISRMRASDHPAYAAGCGQLFMTTRDAYQKAGTHEAIRQSRHDGLKLPRAYRESGLMTDVVDGTHLADCRMYQSAGQVIRGVMKNAIEGIANPKLILIFSILLIGGSALPMITLIWSIVAVNKWGMLLSTLGVVVGHAPRAIAAVRFRQSIAGVVFHSMATLVFVLLQWAALGMHLLGRQVAWRGRSES